MITKTPKFCFSILTIIFIQTFVITIPTPSYKIPGLDKEDLKDLSRKMKNLLIEFNIMDPNKPYEINLMNKTHPTFQELNKVLPWNMTWELEDSFRITADQILYMNIFLFKKKWSSQTVIKGFKCQKDLEIDPSSSATFTKANFHYLKKTFISFIKIYSKFYEQAPQAIKENSINMNEFQEDTDPTKTTKSHIEMIPKETFTKIFDGLNDEILKSNIDSYKFYDEWRNSLKNFRCQFKDLMTFYGILPRFFVAYKAVLEKSTYKRNKIFQELAEIASEWRTLLSEMDKIEQLMEFYMTIFREMRFFIAEANEDEKKFSAFSKQKWVIVMGKVNVDFFGDITTEYKKMLQIIDESEKLYVRIVKNILKLESIGRIKNKTLFPTMNNNHVGCLKVLALGFIGFWFF